MTIVVKANVPGAISNTGKVVGTNLLANNTSTAVVNVTAATADVGIVKTANTKSVTVGDNVTYTFVMTNYRPGEATDVALGDLLPASTTFVSVKTTQGTCTGTKTVTCALGTLGLGKTATVVLVVKTTAAGTIPNTAQVVAHHVDQRPTNNASTATVKAVKAVTKAPAKKTPAKQAPAKKTTPGAPAKKSAPGFTG